MRFPLFVVGAACFAMAGCSDDIFGRNDQATKRPEAMCGDASPLETFLIGWTCDTLAVAGEPELPLRQDGEIETYRVTWMPSFSPSVIVRIESTGAGKARMFVKTVYAQAVGEPKKLLSEREFVLEDSEFFNYRAALESAGFWQLPVFADELEAKRMEEGSLVGCMDGTVMYLEGQKSGNYQLASAHCAPFPGVAKVASFTYQFAALRAEELNQYR